MVSASPPTTEPGADLLAAAEALAPRLRAAAEEIDRERRLPDDILQAMREAGFFRMEMPRDVGGLQIDPLLRIRVIEEIAAANGSAGWLLMLFSSQNGWAAGWLPEATAQEIFGVNPDALLCLVAQPPGRAHVVPGGYRVSGRWPFASGSVHAAWFVSRCQIYEADEPVLDEAGKPRGAHFVVPAAAATIHDTWDSAGLRGSSSHDYSIENVFVGAGWQFNFFGTTSRLAEPAFAYAGLSFCSMPAVSLGIARAAVEAAAELVQGKHAPRANAPLSRDSAVQAELGRAAALVESGRAYLHAAVAQLWQELQKSRTRSSAVRVSYRLATAQAVQNAVQAVDIVHALAGSSAVYRSNPLERYFRDIHTAATHGSMRVPAAYATAGQLLLGIEPAMAAF
jgi:alkylation response protein AidB-like acyl-CoA dehydrogenase